MGRKRKIYPESFKKKMVKEYENGDIDTIEFAKQKGIPLSTFRKWIDNYRESNDLEFEETVLNSSVKPIDITKETKDIAKDIKAKSEQKIDIEIKGITLTLSTSSLKAFLEVLQNG